MGVLRESELKVEGQCPQVNRNIDVKMNKKKILLRAVHKLRDRCRGEGGRIPVPNYGSSPGRVGIYAASWCFVVPKLK